ncbi:MAG: helical backbone metal receptor [Treponema sp.]|nr:helical backbone metal receptor [Treponema sp.]
MIFNKKNVRLTWLTLLLLVSTCVFAQNNTALVSRFEVQAANRVVSLSPAASEILFAIGAGEAVVGVTDLCEVPAEFTQIVRVGGFDRSSLSIEKIVACRPDVVYATLGMHDYVVEQLRRYNIAVYLSYATSIKAVLDEIQDWGCITHHVADAACVTDSITSIVSDIQKRIAGKQCPSVYWEVWNAPYMSVGKTSFMHDILTAAGGNNIFSDIAQDYPMISEESILARKPEVILIPDMEKETFAGLKNRSGWALIPAIRNKKVYFIDADKTSRPGPRVGQAVLELARLLHPEEFRD